MLATGESGGRGPKPKWLEATTGFTVTGLEPGSTVLTVDAPRLGETAGEIFAQQELWGEQPNLNHTALELATLAIEEAGDADSPGERFDNGVLEAALEFKKAIDNPEARYELVPEGSVNGRLKLDEKFYSKVAGRIEETPRPKAYIVSGKLDEIKHSAKRFQLVLDGNAKLWGRLCGDALDAEVLRPLWGRQVTVEGIVHFKANGQSRFIEARRMRACAKGDQVFRQIPLIEKTKKGGRLTIRGKPIQPFDPIKLAGAWPGDEPVEDLLADLD